MNQGLVLLVVASTIFSAKGEDVRLAQFNLETVMQRSEHAQEVRNAAHVGSFSRNDSPVLKKYYELKDRMTNLYAEAAKAQAGTPEALRLEQAAKIAELDLMVNQLWSRMEVEHAVAKSENDSGGQKLIYEEIIAEASALAAEKGYLLVIKAADPKDVIPGVIVTGKVDDVTEELLRRMNAKYRARVGSTIDQKP